MKYNKSCRIRVVVLLQLKANYIFTSISIVNKQPGIHFIFDRPCKAVSHQDSSDSSPTETVNPDRQVTSVKCAGSPPGLFFFHEFLALLSSPLVDWVARIIDLERVFVLHVGIFYLSALLIKLENMGHPAFILILA